MYCIVRCPKCLYIQGTTYPIKTTRCRRCSKSIDLEKIGPLGIFEDHDSMQRHLIEMKWGREAPVEELKETLENATRPQTGSPQRGRDKLRRSILDRAQDIISVEELVRVLSSEGYEREDIEACVEELIQGGMLYSPRYGLIRKPS
ncbi:MAG: hypothetical protein ACMUHB_03405 [Thermoplasmatota archaeon]